MPTDAPNSKSNVIEIMASDFGFKEENGKLNSRYKNVAGRS